MSEALEKGSNECPLPLRIIHFSMQSNHLHFIVEAENNSILTKGMRSLTVSFAKGLKQGRVQIERYHLHVLRTIMEVKHAVQYVLFNQQKHERGRYSKIDEYSSLLGMKDALRIIQEFAKAKKITLHVGKGSNWGLDEGDSYLLKRGIQFIC